MLVERGEGFGKWLLKWHYEMLTKNYECLEPGGMC